MYVHRGDILEFHNNLYAIVIPSNESVRMDGSAIIDDPLGQRVTSLFPDFPWALGDKLTLYGNQVFYYEKWNVFSFPVKDGWNLKSDLKIIERSLIELSRHPMVNSGIPLVMPKLGCIGGQVNWYDVETLLERYLPDSLVVDED